MLELFLRRVVISAGLVIAVSFLTFALVSIMPGDAAYTILGARATAEQLAKLHAELGLDQPMLVQYGHWLFAAVRGDMGKSLITGQPVAEALSQRFWPTLSLVTISFGVIAVTGCLLGIFAAVRQDVTGRTLEAFAFVGVAVPNFVLALIMVPIFAVTLHWLPASGYVSPSETVLGWARSLVLPVFALAFGSVGFLAKQTRAAVQEVLGREFVTAMRANGFRTRSIIYHHAFKVAAVPILATLGVVFVGLLSGTVIIEVIFAVPGLGGLAVQGATQADLPIVQGVTVVFALFVVAVNFLLDFAYVAVNPKVRHGN